MTKRPPFDEWQFALDDYRGRIAVLVEPEPEATDSAGPDHRRQLAHVRERYTQVLELINRSLMRRLHAEECRIADSLAILGDEIEVLEGRGA
jgi:hypothetical protein